MPIATVFFDFGDTLVFTNAAGESQRFIDTLDVLQVLQERGWRIGLLSNQSAGTTVAQVQARSSNFSHRQLRAGPRAGAPPAPAELVAA